MFDRFWTRINGFRTDWRDARQTTRQIDRRLRRIVAAVEAEEPPLNLLLDRAGRKNALKLDDLKSDFDTWAERSEGADFPETELAQAG